MKRFISFICIFFILLSSCSKTNKQIWYLEKINSKKLLENEKEKDIKIAILDSGFNHNFNILFENGTIEYGYDFIDQDNFPIAEYNLHGTYISYLISGMRNSIYNGIDSRLTLEEIRIFDESGNTSQELVKQGIQYAIDIGCQVINISFGSFNYDTEIAKLIENHNEIYFVCAVGDNENKEKFLFPSSLETTISVCAVDEENKLYSSSNFLKKETIKAPGVNLEIPTINSKKELVYTKVSGSSYATALVSGIIGSALMTNSLNTNNLIENTLYSSGYLDCNKFII